MSNLVSMSWSYQKSVAFTLFYFLILVYSLTPFDSLKPLIFEISSFSAFLKTFSSLSLMSLNLKIRERDPITFYHSSGFVLTYLCLMKFSTLTTTQLAI